MQLRLLSRLLNQEINVNDKTLYLRAPTQSDFEQWLRVRTKSQSFLKPWEPQWPHDDLSKIGFRRRLKSYSKQRQANFGKTYFLFKRNTDDLIGGISLTRITYGTTHSAMLGYWMSVDHAGQGNMRKAVPAILKYAFNNLKLERVEAACLPKNEASIHLLKKSGFAEEGYAREYLEINGKREDHVLFASLASEFAQ